MCITLPGRVIEVGEGKATIDIFGRQQKIKILDTGITVGDWVLSANDYAVKKISAAEALSPSTSRTIGTDHVCER